jgi:hypothetical protein
MVEMFAGKPAIIVKNPSQIEEQAGINQHFLQPYPHALSIRGSISFILYEAISGQSYLQTFTLVSHAQICLFPLMQKNIWEMWLQSAVR